MSETPRRRAPVIADVARVAGVSVPTVSRVLTGSTPVTDATRQRVLDAIDELGYRPNEAARALVIFPLLRPVIATATILLCLYIWNDVFYSFFVLSGGSVTTLPLNLFSVASNNLYQNNWNLIFAYVVIMSIPLLVVFIVAQRRIISGITGGAVK